MDVDVIGGIRMEGRVEASWFTCLGTKKREHLFLSFSLLFILPFSSLHPSSTCLSISLFPYILDVLLYHRCCVY